MSACDNLICLDCNEILWIGQNGHLYLNDHDISNTNKFLNKHRGHNLTYKSDMALDGDENYKQFLI